ncbi:proteasome assembly chaperone family protein [Candidatus Thorarchaeota archaeon]|nr:MAG: proteasome assembly chaperone family protein [Candidatus Thorarchaeota archaeon]
MDKDCDAKVLGAPEAHVVQTKEMKLDNPLMVCCFPSAGVVGPIAAHTIIDQFKMEEIAHLRSRYMPSAAVFLEGRLRHPFRIYGSKELNLIVITAELPVSEEGLYAVSSALLDWGSTMGVKETVVLDGIPVQGLPSERKVLFAAEEEKIPELAKNAQMEILDKGIITGIAGSILSETLCRSMIGFALLTPAITVIPDPGGAQQLLEALNQLYDLKIDIKELMEGSEIIRKKMEEMAQQVDGMQRQQSSAGSDRYQRMYA